MLLPGAAISTPVAPKWEKLESPSTEFEDATAMMLGASKLDGKCGTRSLSGISVPLSTLPAAATNKMPALLAWLMASTNCWLKSAPPKLAFKTLMFAPFVPPVESQRLRIVFAYWMASIASDVSPKPFWSRNFKDIKPTDQLTPTTTTP